MLVEPGLCWTCSETTLLVSPEAAHMNYVTRMEDNHIILIKAGEGDRGNITAKHFLCTDTTVYV